jgi:hypothetical protein
LKVSIQNVKLRFKQLGVDWSRSRGAYTRDQVPSGNATWTCMCDALLQRGWPSVEPAFVDEQVEYSIVMKGHTQSCELRLKPD